MSYGYDPLSRPDETTTSHILLDSQRIELIDGYGRRYLSDNPGEIEIQLHNGGRQIEITHSGDTSHGFIQDGQMVTTWPTGETVPAPRPSRLRRLQEALRDRWAIRQYRKNRYRGLRGGQDD